MNRSLTTNGPLAPAAVLLSIVMLIVALAGPGLFPASADQFTPLEDPPSITVVSSEIFTLKDEATASLDLDDYEELDGDAIQPAFPRSGTVYNVFLDLATNGDLSNVTEIRLCLYDSADDDFDTDEKIAAVCGIAEDDDGTAPLSDAPTAWTNSSDADTANFTPEKVFVIRWLADEDGDGNAGFRVENGGGTVNYKDEGSAFTPDGQEARARFSFSVSNAMQVSSGWKIRAAAESVSDTDTRDPKGQSAQDLPAATFEVAYFGHMSNEESEVRPSIDFEVVVPNTTKVQQDIRTGHYTANDVSSLTIRGTNFTFDDAGTPRTVALATNGDFGQANTDRREKDRNDTAVTLDTPLNAADAVLNVPDGQVSLDCAFVAKATTADNASAFVQVTTASRIFATSGITATGEALRTNLSDHTCALSYRGAAPVANEEYTNTVIMGLVQGTGVALGGDAPSPNFEAGD